jgi:hypothetical protein
MTDTFLDLDEVIDAAPEGLAPTGVVWPAGYTLNNKGLWWAKDGESAPVQLSGHFRVPRSGGDPTDPDGRSASPGTIRMDHCIRLSLPVAT